MLFFIVQSLIILGSGNIKDVIGTDDLKDDDNCATQIRHICEDQMSCRLKCGVPLIPTLDGQKLCSCDYLCPLYKDCCYDFEMHCTFDYNMFYNMTSLKRLTNIKSQCFGPYLAVSSCVDDSDKIDLVDLSPPPKKEIRVDVTNFEKLYDTQNKAFTGNVTHDYVLVSDHECHVGLAFSSEEILRCNFPEMKSKKWNKRYQSNKPFKTDDLERFFSYGTSSDQFLNALFDVPPDSVFPRFCPPEIHLTCDFQCDLYHNKTFKSFSQICQALKSEDSLEIKPRNAKKKSLSLGYSGFSGNVDGPNGYSEFPGNFAPTSMPHSLKCFATHSFKIEDSTRFDPEQPSAKFIFDGPKKALIKNSMFPILSGGWDQIICNQQSYGTPCNLTFSCDLSALYSKNQCIQPSSILILISSTSNDPEHDKTWEVWFSFVNELRKQSFLTFENEDHYEVTADGKKSLNYIHITRPVVVAEPDMTNTYGNRYKDIFIHIFEGMYELYQDWQGKVSTYYYSTPKHNLKQFFNMSETAGECGDGVFFCEDIMPYENYTHGNHYFMPFSGQMRIAWCTQSKVILTFIFLSINLVLYCMI